MLDLREKLCLKVSFPFGVMEEWDQCEIIQLFLEILMAYWAKVQCTIPGPNASYYLYPWEYLKAHTVCCQQNNMQPSSHKYFNYWNIASLSNNIVSICQNKSMFSCTVILPCQLLPASHPPSCPGWEPCLCKWSTSSLWKPRAPRRWSQHGSDRNRRGIRRSDVSFNYRTFFMFSYIFFYIPADIIPWKQQLFVMLIFWKWVIVITKLKMPRNCTVCSIIALFMGL